TAGPEGLTATTRGVPAAIATPAARVQARPSAAARSLKWFMGSLFGLDVIGEAFMLQEPVLPGLDVLQLPLIALEAVLLESVFGEVVGQPEAQFLPDSDELQPVLLQPPAHDNEPLLIEVVESHRAGQRCRHHVQAGDLPERDER